MGEMTADANLRGAMDDPDEARLVQLSGELADGIDQALPRWVERCVRRRIEESGVEPGAGLVAAIDDASRQARTEVGGAVRDLLDRDVDDQPTGPLAVLRRAVRFPTEVLVARGVPPVVRDPDAERLFPGDVYDLTPGSFADIDPALHEPGIAWGAAKAYVHLARRRSEGRR